jgi:hypothetical protein
VAAKAEPAPKPRQSTPVDALLADAVLAELRLERVTAEQVDAVEARVLSDRGDLAPESSNCVWKSARSVAVVASFADFAIADMFSASLVIALMPLSAASKVFTARPMPSWRRARSAARLLRAEAWKKFRGSSSARRLEARGQAVLDLRLVARDPLQRQDGVTHRG